VSSGRSAASSQTIRRQKGKMISLLQVALLSIAMATPAPNRTTAQAINQTALDALSDKNLVIENNVVKLYGVKTNGADTEHGAWACAKVVTIILKQAGAIDQILLGVGKVEEKLSRWKKIEQEEDLKPGDVIVWLNRVSGRKDRRCTGGGNCHVGIVTDKGYFHNSPITHQPSFDGASLWAFEFKVGYRPAE